MENEKESLLKKIAVEDIHPTTCVNKVKVERMCYVPQVYQKCLVCQYYDNAYVCHMFAPIKDYLPKDLK